MEEMLGRSEIGKIRKQMLTRELPSIVTCGHKFDPELPPKNNCEGCWFQYLNQDGKKVLAYHDEYKADKQAMIGKYGSKFVKMYGRFMATVLQMKRRENEAVGSVPVLET